MLVSKLRGARERKRATGVKVEGRKSHAEMRPKSSRWPSSCAASGCRCREIAAELFAPVNGEARQAVHGARDREHAGLILLDMSVEIRTFFAANEALGASRGCSPAAWGGEMRCRARAGLGLEAQREAVQAFAAAEGFEIIAEFTEVETGKGSDALDRRPKLKAALKAAKKANVKSLSPSWTGSAAMSLSSLA